MGKRSQMAIGHGRPTGRKIDQTKLAMTKRFHFQKVLWKLLLTNME